MGIWQQFTVWLKARLHLKPGELRGAPGVHDPAAAADHVNAAVGSVIDSVGASTVENALKVRPEQLHGAPGITDHAAAADAINALVDSKLSDTPIGTPVK